MASLASEGRTEACKTDLTLSKNTTKTFVTVRPHMLKTISISLGIENK